jgi:RNA polymerase primary sigma factor
VSKYEAHRAFTRMRIPREERSLDIYLDAISVFPLLAADEEVRLARRIKQGNEKALEKLVNANLRFVVTVAKPYRNHGLTLGELINQGNLGLIKAAERFDETRGFRFITYAVWWIRQAILQALAEQGRVIRQPLNRVGQRHRIRKAAEAIVKQEHHEPSLEEIAATAGLDEREVRELIEMDIEILSLDEPTSDGKSTHGENLEDQTSPVPDEDLHQQRMVQIVKGILNELSARDAEIIRLYYYQDFTLEEVGAVFGFSRERVRQIMVKLNRKMRYAARRHGITNINDFLNPGSF